MSEPRTAWAIALDGYESKQAFAGVWFFQTAGLSPHHSGVKVAMFATRRAAREAVAERFPPGSYAKTAYKPRVCRVVINITEAAKS